MTTILKTNPIRLGLDGAIRNIRRAGTPDRVFHFEHGKEPGIRQALCDRFDLVDDLDPQDPHFALQREICLHQFVGLEFMRVFPGGIVWPGLPTDTTAAPPTVGPIQSWDDFEAYPWPRIEHVDFSTVDWFEANLPDDMAMWAMTYLFQQVSNLIGFAPLCMMLYENRPLVEAVTQKVGEFYVQFTEVLCGFSRCGAINVGDDLGHKTATLIAPDDIRAMFIPWHTRIIATAHACGKLGLFHVCGQVESIMDDLIDAKHSTQDVIEPITVSKDRWGDRVALLGGVDVDFITRATPDDVRAYTRDILDHCVPDGGFAFGVGNWVADSIPVDNYVAMLETAREYEST